MQKRVHDLVLQDFRINPIWRPVDDFEDPDMLVEPFSGKVLNLEEVYLVSATVIFADKSEYEGYVRYSWGTPVVVRFSPRENEFVSFPLEHSAANAEWRLEFLKKQNKKEDDVFPFIYQISVDVRFEGTVY